MSDYFDIHDVLANETVRCTCARAPRCALQQRTTTPRSKSFYSLGSTRHSCRYKTSFVLQLLPVTFRYGAAKVAPMFGGSATTAAGGHVRS